MKNILKKYVSDNKGQFAVVTAVCAFPLLLAVGISVDTALILNKSTGVQSALDSAVLAAIVPGYISDSEREKYAETVFLQNFDSDAEVNVIAKATSGQIYIKATLEKETLFMGMVGKTTVIRKNRSAAIKSVEDVVCVMTLDKSRGGSLTIEKDAIIQAPNCSIQVNSSHSEALLSQGNYEPRAKRICSHRGVKGNFGPNVQANCTAVDDPYADLNLSNLMGEAACDYGPIVPGDMDSYAEIIDLQEADKVKYPGVYCGGLHIFNADVKFEPGTYIMRDGPLTIGGESKVKAKDATFIFSGDGSYLYTYDNPKIKFSASESGRYGGLIFFQDRDSSKDDVSIIKGSADIKLVGTAYFPTQDLFVGGVGEMGADSPAMAFIANNITFTSDIKSFVSKSEAQFQTFKGYMALLYRWRQIQSGELGAGSSSTAWPPATSSPETEAPEIATQTFTTTILTSLGSHDDAGLPPVLPRSDGGARLVSAEGPNSDPCSGQDICPGY